MSSERNLFGSYKAGDEIARIAAAATLTPEQDVVDLDSTVAAFILTLANPAKMRGRFVSLRLQAGATNAVTVSDGQVDANWTDLVIDAALDGALLWCDGQHYWVVSNEIA